MPLRIDFFDHRAGCTERMTAVEMEWLMLFRNGHMASKGLNYAGTQREYQFAQMCTTAHSSQQPSDLPSKTWADTQSGKQLILRRDIAAHIGKGASIGRGSCCND